MESGAVQESGITGDFISSVRSLYESIRDRRMAARGPGVTGNSASGPVVIASIGLGGSGVIYALVMVPNGPYGTYGLVAIDETGNGSLVAKLKIADPIGLARGLVVVGLEVGVVFTNGDIAWYPIPS